MKIHSYSVYWDNCRTGSLTDRRLARVGGNVCVLNPDDLRRVCSTFAEDYPEYDVILIIYYDEGYLASVRSSLVRNASGGFDPVPVD